MRGSGPTKRKVLQIDSTTKQEKNNELVTMLRRKGLLVLKAITTAKYWNWLKRKADDASTDFSLSSVSLRMGFVGHPNGKKAQQLSMFFFAGLQMSPAAGQASLHLNPFICSVHQAAKAWNAPAMSVCPKTDVKTGKEISLPCGRCFESL
mmetsp:Transcript_42143/g.65975  ORF Transcript_42143/g.65975 Transcript_42143/m.65975 type:complete len:150 (+) Transcript_42143:1674-2123(+)